jgi:hypothetical protein
MARKRKDLAGLVHSILKEMYENSTPPADLDEIIRTGEGEQDNFFLKYYLNDEDFEAIFKKWTDGIKLSKHEMSLISLNVYLGASPCSNKDTVNRTRLSLGLNTI